MKLVIYPAVEQDRLEKICSQSRSLTVVNAASLPEALEAIADAEAFFGKLTPQLLSHAQRLRWVQAPTASLEHYLFPELISHECLLSNMRGLFSDVIADHVLGLVIAFARNFPQYYRQQMAGIWSPVGGENARASFTSGPGVVNAIDLAHRQLSDCTLGIVGVGAIGSEVARRAQAFKMQVLGVDPVCRSLPGEGANPVLEVWPMDQLPALLGASDFVVIAAPHTPETEKLFNAHVLGMMRPTACLINIGRGAIVDLTALTAALQEGTIAGAGLDVFEVEPLPAGHPLWAMPNVIITPHVAGMFPRIAERHLETLLENVRRFAEGHEPTNLVDKQKWF